jgi:glyoxylase I family protein
VEKALGIGGLFFRARDPVALARWYAEQLGIALTPASYDEQPWHQAAVPTAFAPFPDTTDYFGAPDRVWMVNFRVRDLAAIVAQLRTAGVEVQVDPEVYPNGSFARLQDPEGNPIELWEPRGSRRHRLGRAGLPPDPRMSGGRGPPTLACPG